MAFRHSIDKGQRVLQNLVDENILLPRWGSYSFTPPPVFKDLKYFPLTQTQDWNDFCGAADIGPDGRQWWTRVEPMPLHEYTTVKSADAARVWLRLFVSHVLSVHNVPSQVSLSAPGW